MGLLKTFVDYLSLFKSRFEGKNYLTHNMAMIQPSFTSSKWNMGEILPFLA